MAEELGSRYMLLGKIFESANCVVFRARRRSDSLPVTIKLPSEPYPPIRKIFRYQREFEIGQRLRQVPGVLHPLLLEPLDHSIALVMEHFEGASLKSWLADRGATLDEALSLAIQLADVLTEIHARNVIHKDLNPANILYDPQARRVKIIDFGISAVFELEKNGLDSATALEGTPAYIAPEQTGKLAYAIDQRSDLYSLGATLYELFTGEQPFDSDDPLELVQCHVLKEPPSPQTVRPGLPSALSDIVMKLLAKSPSRRYQSARGLKADLERCQELSILQGSTRTFPLGTDDHPDRLLVSERLYGRESAAQALAAALATACATGPVVVLLSGPSGVGKTSLVRDFLPLLTEHPALFASGKFEPLAQNRPYSAIVAAFQQLGLRLLTLRDEELSAIQKRLREALGQNTEILAGLLPEFRDILAFRQGRSVSLAGEENRDRLPAPELGTAENKNRLVLAFQKVVATLSDPQAPLILFLDDLQWADAASLELLSAILQGSASPGLMLIAAYRDGELGPADPQTRALESLAQTAHAVRLGLAPLGVDEINQLLADTLRCDRGEAQELARLLGQKTQGNPLFLKAYLRTLWAKGLLSIQPRTGEWLWDLSAIGKHEVADNVAEFLSTKVGALSAQTREALQIAACFGSRFDLQSLAAVSGRTAEQTNRALLEATGEGVVTPLQEWSFGLELTLPIAVNMPAVEFKFVHDRIQQAAYGLLEPAARRRLHTRIGQRLLGLHPVSERGAADDTIFDIANHLNQGLTDDDAPASRVELARLNLFAGQRAKGTASFGLAYGYFQRGMALLGPAGFQQHRALCVALHEDAAEAACQNADLPATEALATALLSCTTEIGEQLKIFGVLLRALNAQHRLQEALATGRLVLSRLGLSCPARASRAHLLVALVQTRIAFSQRAIARLDGQTPLGDPMKLRTLEILSTLLQSSYVVDPNLAVLFVTQQARISLQFGDSLFAPYAYASYGALLCLVGAVDTGCRLGELALARVDRQPGHPQRAKTYVAVFGFVLHWKQNLHSTLLPLQKASAFGLESGDLEYATVASLIYCMHSFFCGVELSGLHQETEIHKAGMIRYNQKWPRVYLEQYRQVVQNLLGMAEAPELLEGSAYETRQMLPAHVTGEDKTALFGHWYHNLYLCCLFGAADHGQAFSTNADRLVDAVMGQFITSRLTFYSALCELDGLAKASAMARLGMLRRVRGKLGKLTRWARHCPGNHLHLVHLLRAELARSRGKAQEASSAYSLASSLAKSSGFINELALVAERATRFFVEQPNLPMAMVCYAEAKNAYQRWGARAKLASLRTRFPELERGILAP